MPLVFVHGVNVRYESNDDPQIVARDGLFRRFALSRIVDKPYASKIINPYWGDVAAQFPYGHGGLPAGNFEAFGSDDQAAIALLANAAQVTGFDPDDPKSLNPDRVLLATASRSLGDAVDAVWAVAIADLKADESNRLAELAARVASYVDSHPMPRWLTEVTSDEEFIARLITEATTPAPVASQKLESPIVEQFGFEDLADRLRNAVTRIREAVVRTRDDLVAVAGRGAEKVGSRVDTLLLRIRAPIHRTVATFLGDIFVWQQQKASRKTEIADRVSAGIQKGVKEREQTDEPLIVIAHSMGGNIVYDLLTSTMKNCRVDTFVTVGSQVAVFEELRLFSASDENIPNSHQKKMPKPENVGRWINIFDSTDILGFAASRVFSDVDDFRFRTGHAWAHGGYFIEPMFHQRLGERLKDIV